MIENPPVDISDPTESVRRNAARLAVLRDTQLLDTEVEEAFDRLTRLAVRLVGIPAAFISLVDENRDFYKSSCGFGEPLASARELRGETFCHFTVASTGPLVIPDTNADPLYRDVPTVRTLGVAAYVGIPLVISGQTIGAFCGTDVTPRNWTTRDVDTLSELAAMATSEIELRSLGRRSEALRTEAEQSRAAAETARGAMSDLFRQAPAFIAVVRGPDHVFELANDRYHDLVGGQDVIGKRVIDAIPEVAGQGFIELLDNVLKTGESFIGTELPVRLSRSSDPDGDLRYVTFVYQATSDSDGTRTGVFVHGVDVTDQVLARHELEALNEQLRNQATQLEMQSEELQTTTETLQVSTEELSERTAVAENARLEAERAVAALASSEGRYRTLTEAVPVQVWTATPDGMLNFVSTQAAAYFGAPSDEALGIGWTKFVHPDDLPHAAALWSAALKNGTPYQAEFRLRNGATGEYRWHLARALPDRLLDGSIAGWIGSNTDVEGERSARADAEAANRSKSEFLAVMSHELRTPLNAIGGYSELLEMGLRGPVTEAQKHDLHRIQRSQRHLLGLINGILNYAKIDAGMVHYAAEDVPMDEVLETCESLTLPQIRDKKLTIKYPAAGLRVVALADREKVEQIVLNLLSNAIKFTENGGRITVECALHNNVVEVQIADTGRGIPTDQLETVFHPFVQVDAKLTRVQEGTGLGLAISRDLARAMNGDITVESTPGMGSTFTLSLPARVTGATESDHPRSLSHAPA